MITRKAYNQLGQADYGWLKARYHFSFANYYNPEQMGFGPLRVINDDLILPGKGFEPHSHRDMEIITYVKSGAISHRDNMGHEGRTQSGDIQVMSAGTGITHSEYNLEDETTSLYQIWITPKAKGMPPRWESCQFPQKMGELSLLVSGDGRAPLQINQDAFLYAGRFKKGQSLKQKAHRASYVLASEGRMTFNNVDFAKGDALQITGEEFYEFQALDDSSLLIIAFDQDF